MKQLRRVLSRQPATFGVYQSLWDAAGERAGRVITSYGDIGADCAVSDRTAQGHVEKLVGLNLVELVDHDRRSGVLILYICDHAAFGQPRRHDGDPQAEMFGNAPDEAAVGEAIDTVSIDAGRKPRAGVSTQKPRADSERPTAENRRQAQPSPPVAARSLAPPSDRPTVCDHGTIDGKSVRQNHAPIEQPGSHGPWGGRGLQDFHRRSQQERDRLARDAPKQIGNAVVGALNRAADRFERSAHPLEQKRQLVAVIVSRVRDREMSEVIAARAAEYVIQDGWPFEELQAVLDDLDRADHEGKIRVARGAWFQGAVRQRIRKCGIRERTRRPQPRPP